ncbi:MAG: hypothetical protein SGPRY_012969, partial [Prymnesium sp.]
ASDLDDSLVCVECAKLLQGLDDSDCEEMSYLLMGAAAEPLSRELKEFIGPEVLSLERLGLEAAAQGAVADVKSQRVR